ncbi:MAG: 2-hydroxyacyl-CoA dehydratase [Candidatus Helarchaeota archaeon]
MINYQIEDFTFQSILDLAVKYILGPHQVRKARKQGKKVIGGFLPPMLLAYAAKNTLPIFLPRLAKFPLYKYYGIVNFFNRLHLLKPLVRHYIYNKESFSSDFFGSFNQDEFSKIFTNLINVAEKANFYMDTCVQTRISYGAYINNLRQLDLVIGGFEGNYCIHFAKFYERIGKYTPIFYFEKPFGDNSNLQLFELITHEIQRFITTLEKLTGTNVTDARLRKMAEINNEIRELIRDLYQYYTKGYVPLHTTALMLVSGAYVDFLSDPEYYRNTLRNLLKEIRHNHQNLPNYKKENILRVIVAGSPGIDPCVPATFENEGAVLLYLDLFESCMLNPAIKITGNIIENYAEYLLTLNIKNGIQDLIDVWIGIAKRIQADAILFSHVWGCRFTTPAFRKFKDRVLEELGIPIAPLDFYSPGENIGQIKTRIGAFIEMMK